MFLNPYASIKTELEIQKTAKVLKLISQLNEALSPQDESTVPPKKEICKNSRHQKTVDIEDFKFYNRLSKLTPK